MITDLQPSFDEQLMVSRIGTDHGRPIGGEEMPDHKRFFFQREVRRRSLGVFEKQIEDRTGSDLLQLEEQRRGKVEGGVHLRKLLEQIGHIIVGFGRMQAHPGHTGRCGQRVRVIGLVHVPEKTDVDLLHCDRFLSIFEYVIGGIGMQSARRFLERWGHEGMR